MLSGYPLFRRIELIFSSSCCSLRFEQIINARCSSVSIKLVLRFVGPNESQRKYCPVKVGFLKTENRSFLKTEVIFQRMEMIAPTLLKAILG